ncbi:MAG: hypothetical protein KTR35_02720 [Gammaproteobacteria bacterium]|nr:hypothetical protein [Gammaproteobacteria bacterium]
MKFRPEDAQPLSLTDAEQGLMDKQPDSDREAKLETIRAELDRLDRVSTTSAESSDLQVATLKLEAAGLMLDLDLKASAWENAKSCLPVLIEQQKFEDAALACQYVYLSDREDALPAIGQAAWLAVTYPVNPHLSANILDMIIDEMPDNSDGAAVVAATAHYVVDLRCAEDEYDELRLFTGGMLAKVARRHSNVESQQMFELWVERLELDDPSKFLVRLRNVIDVMVQQDWWFDREKLQAALPE